MTKKTAPSPSWGGVGKGFPAAATGRRGRGLVQAVLSDEGRKDPNLTFVQDRIASSPPREQRPLPLYRRVQRGDVVADDDRSLLQNRLELYGLVGCRGAGCRCAIAFMPRSSMAIGLRRPCRSTGNGGGRQWQRWRRW
ncbi:MAG: hypothetical protein R3E79_08415 [Caldilineaceae bacterium]